MFVLVDRLSTVPAHLEAFADMRGRDSLMGYFFYCYTNHETHPCFIMSMFLLRMEF